MFMEDRIDYERVVEMIVYCPDWREKEQILRRAVRRLVELEMIDQINTNLTQNESEYEMDET